MDVFYTRVVPGMRCGAMAAVGTPTNQYPATAIGGPIPAAIGGPSSTRRSSLHSSPFADTV